MVHFSRATNRRVVVAVFLERYGTAAHAGFKPIVDNFPRQNRQNYVRRDQVKLTSLLPQPPGTAYVRYDGSLTTPPCSENVTWIVFIEPVVLSQAQIDVIRQRYPMNARMPQARSERTLQSSIYKR